jgi:hypothetical protein
MDRAVIDTVPSRARALAHQEREEVIARQRELAARLVEIERELAAINAYETTRSSAVAPAAPVAPSRDPFPAPASAHDHAGASHHRPGQTVRQQALARTARNGIPPRRFAAANGVWPEHRTVEADTNRAPETSSAARNTADTITKAAHHFPGQGAASALVSIFQRFLEKSDGEQSHNLPDHLMTLLPPG